MASLAENEEKSWTEFNLEDLSTDECNNLVILLTSMHKAKNEMLLWTRVNAQYSSYNNAVFFVKPF